MTTLKIEDLSCDTEMDRTAMTQVHGGRLPEVMEDLIQAVHDGTHPSKTTPPVEGGLMVPVGSIYPVHLN